MPHAILDVAILAPPGTPAAALELVEYVQPVGAGAQPTPGDVGFAHLSLLVDDIQSEHRRLCGRGVLFRSEPVVITVGTNAGGHVCYFVDPDGNGLELFEPPKPVSR